VEDSFIVFEGIIGLTVTEIAVASILSENMRTMNSLYVTGRKNALKSSDLLNAAWSSHVAVSLLDREHSLMSRPSVQFLVLLYDSCPEQSYRKYPVTSSLIPPNSLAALGNSFRKKKISHNYRVSTIFIIDSTESLPGKYF
jgi:hypothetical protein